MSGFVRRLVDSKATLNYSKYIEIKSSATLQDEAFRPAMEARVQLVGKILWWNDRDGFGVIEDADGNEYYLDSSVVARMSQTLIRNQIVIFEINDGISDCLSAHRVRVANAAERKKAGRNLDSKQLRLQPADAGAK